MIRGKMRNPPTAMSSMFACSCFVYILMSECVLCMFAS